MNVLARNNIQTMIYTYKRNYRKLRIFYIILSTFILTFFVLKFFKTGELKLSMRVTEYINNTMDRILKYKTREKQNEEFRKLAPEHPLEPIRMTLTTAVFKYTGVTPNVILKRIIYNPSNKLNEDYMSKCLSSPYLCRTIKTYRTRRTVEDGSEQILIWIFFEFLDIKISQRTVNGNEETIRKILTDVLKGLEYMHSHSIAHLDMKIGNIMGKATEKGIVYKLIDFGYSQLMPNTGSVVIPRKNYGTYPYKAPEVVFKNEHGLKSDIWSLGAICWFLSLQYTPFYLDGFEKDLPSYRRFLKKRTDNPEDRNNHKFVFSRNSSTELKDFVKRCMQVEPELRPTVSELLSHPFIKGERANGILESEDEIEEGTYEDYSTESITYQ
ncbi:serine/threonine protein kinase [Vittaforma corneae ATCC 50505]|uniref:Serine/threonine protein kinase n=1 Tax=Vittaforma corneae (strain ATCC 50505) TaxID=993615 RepID=L2GN73_VITCO|nr:serine/threonine protein kinase [Vittaforma corneae ATCC 50505]ELA42281.1 serine/threonine protein kinase [Vittaforma corneae ATCC 50505]